MPAGHARLTTWAQERGIVDGVGVEGTGSDDAGMTRHLLDHGIRVMEVVQPNHMCPQGPQGCTRLGGVDHRSYRSCRTSSGIASGKQGTASAISSTAFSPIT